MAVNVCGQGVGDGHRLHHSRVIGIDEGEGDRLRPVFRDARRVSRLRGAPIEELVVRYV